MKTVDWSQFLENGLQLHGKQSSMTVGVFDGVHLGHQALIKKIISQNENYTPVIFTFRQNHKTDSKDILSFKERLAMFGKLGIQITVVIDFTSEFKLMPGIEFLNLLLKHGGIGFFAVGSDFRCGYQLDTDAKAIQNFFASRNIPAEIVSQVIHESLPVSSSRIRAALASGDIAMAEKMLGYTIKK